MSNDAASEMARQRWAKASDAEKSEHARKMNEARWGPKKAVKKAIKKAGKKATK